MRLIHQEKYRRQPWKNGLGETIEIAVSPPGASVDDFDWRVSMAKVDADGPFSTFPEIDRTLTVLEGRGIDLMVAGFDPVRIETAPHSFPGDAQSAATLIDGPIIDLNVMTRRGKLAHRVALRSLTAAWELIARSPVVLIYCKSGGIQVEDDIAPPVEMRAGDTLLIEARPMDYRLNPQGEAAIILVEIGPA